jgi:hypothetical protein
LKGRREDSGKAKADRAEVAEWTIMSRANSQADDGKFGKAPTKNNLKKRLKFFSQKEEKIFTFALPIATSG